jgi:hypothetical protein
LRFKDLVKKERKQNNLKHYQPFKRKFRTVLATELKDEKVLKELLEKTKQNFTTSGVCVPKFIKIKVI